MPTAPPPKYGRVTPTELSCYRLASTVAAGRYVPIGRVDPERLL